MLELVRTRISVIGCAADGAALDALASSADALVLRTAPDEALVVGRPDDPQTLLGEARHPVTAADPDAVVVDATDGWIVWTLAGDDARHAFARLSALPLPDVGWVQGRVAGVPAKAIVGSDAIDVLVPAMWSDHVRTLIRRTGSDLGLRETDEPRAWSAWPHEETTTR